jgi:cytochrome c553
MMKKMIILVGSLLFAYTDCAMCHNGGMAKSLSNYSSNEIIKKMKEFKIGNGNPMMVNIAKAMSESDIKEAANKYGKR